MCGKPTAEPGFTRSYPCRRSALSFPALSPHVPGETAGWGSVELSRDTSIGDGYRFSLVTDVFHGPLRQRDELHGRLHGDLSIRDGRTRFTEGTVVRESILERRPDGRGFTAKVTARGLPGKKDSAREVALEGPVTATIGLNLVVAPAFARLGPGTHEMRLFEPAIGFVDKRITVHPKTPDGLLHIAVAGHNEASDYWYEPATRRIVRFTQDRGATYGENKTEAEIRAALAPRNTPQGDILVQPFFRWEDGSETANGTAFLTRTKHGAVVAVGSAHYVVDEKLPQHVTFMSTATRRPIAPAIRTAYGPVSDGDPATAISDDSGPSRDYFFVRVPSDTHDTVVLTLDKRPHAKVWERVWFPVKNFDNGVGYDLVGATVVEVSRDSCLVLVDKTIELQSESGTPFISERTGHVIGTMMGSGVTPKGLLVQLQPSQAISKALAEDRVELSLRDATAKERGN